MTNRLNGLGDDFGIVVGNHSCEPLCLCNEDSVLEPEPAIAQIQHIPGAEQALMDQIEVLERELADARNEISSMRRQIRHLKATVGGFRSVGLRAIGILDELNPENEYRTTLHPEDSDAWKSDFAHGFRRALHYAITEERKADTQKIKKQRS